MAFRTELRDQLLPIPQRWLYDAWLAAVLSATGKYTLIEECLQLYRQHENNALGGRRLGVFSEISNAFNTNRASYLETEKLRWQQLSKQLEKCQTSAWILLRLEEKICHLLRREALPHNRSARIPHVFAEIMRGGYSRFSRNWGSIALDLLLK